MQDSLQLPMTAMQQVDHAGQPPSKTPNALRQSPSKKQLTQSQPQQSGGGMAEKHQKKENSSLFS